VDWSVLSSEVAQPYSPVTLDWIANGYSTKVRSPHTEKENTNDFYHLASFETEDTIIAHIVTGSAAVVGTYEYDPTTEVANRIYATNTPFGGYCNYQGRVFLAKTAGASSWDGTTFTAAAFTGASGGTSLPACCIYRDRYIQVQGTSLFFSPLSGAVSGALNTFNLASYYTSGDFVGCAPITITDSNNLADYLVLISQGGDFLAFTGDFPGSANWQLVVKTKLDVAPFTTFGGASLGLCPYPGDAWIYSRKPATLVSARALIQSGRIAAEAESPLANQINYIRRSDGILRNVTYASGSNSLLVESTFGANYIRRIFGMPATFQDSIFLNIDLKSGAVSPFTPPGFSGTENGSPFFNKLVGHSDGFVYGLSANTASLWKFLDSDNLLYDAYMQPYLQFPTSDLGVPDSEKSLLMSYLVMSQERAGSLSFYAKISVQTDMNRDAVATFDTQEVATTDFSKRLITPIAGQGSEVDVAIWYTFDPEHYCESISLQFEQGGPY